MANFSQPSFFRFTRLAPIVCLATICLGSEAQAQWSFVSSPDLFNSDIADLSGGSVAAINNEFPDPVAYANAMSGLVAPGFTNNGHNSLNPQMAATYNQLLAEMQSNAGGSASTFLVAGDLMNGRWPQNSNALQTNFGGGNLAQAIDNAADIYFGFHRELFRQHGFTDHLTAIGDHELGDNNWGAGSTKANSVDNMKRAFGRNFVDPLGLPPTWNGLSSTAPAGAGEYDEGSYVKQVNNVLFVTVDVFRWEGGGSNLHYAHGAMDSDVTGTVGDANTHLGWLDAVLTAADSDASVDHVILQGHTPVLPGVRKQSSSGMMMHQRDDSPFWQVLQDHDQQSGGKVRMYFGGEVHQVTSSKDVDSDIVQLVHGNPPLGGGGTNYVVFDVDGKRLDARLYSVDLSSAGGGTYWQVSEGNKTGTASANAGELVGTMTIDASATNTTYQTSGWLDFVDYRGLLAHYAFEDAEQGGAATNTGSLGDLEYSAARNGSPTPVNGKFGKALDFDGAGDYLRTNGLAPITEGEQRTVAAWVKTTETDTQAIFGYGQSVTSGGEFNLQLDSGVLQLSTNGNGQAKADNPPINDGDWHHVAVVLPGKHFNDMGDLLFYVDGVEYTANASNPTAPVRTSGTSKSRIHIAANATNKNSGQHFTGSLDDVALWGAPLSAGKLKSLVNGGNEVSLRLDAMEMETLFDLHDTQAGSTTAGGYTWTYATGLTGQPGDVIAVNELDFAIVLDESGNGVLGDVDVVLTVDRDTGAVQLVNSSNAPLLLDGYTISSSAGGLNPSDSQWSSNFDRGLSEWVEANPTDTRLSELRVNGVETLAVGESFDLGTPFQPTPAEFGEPIEDLSLTFSTPTGELIEAAVHYSGANVNNLVLIVDPASGRAMLRNGSTFDIQFEGYTLTSTNAPLDVSGFEGLSDDSVPGWIEANPSNERLTELNISGTTLLAAGSTYDLGDLFDGTVPLSGLELRFWANGDASSNGAVGYVIYEPLGLPGDFDNDGDVDGADFLQWQRGESNSPLSASDLQAWQANYGSRLGQLGAAAEVVPEPSAHMFTVSALLWLSVRR